jgi:hypothetical protein
VPERGELGGEIFPGCFIYRFVCGLRGSGCGEERLFLLRAFRVGPFPRGPGGIFRAAGIVGFHDGILPLARVVPLGALLSYPHKAHNLSKMNAVPLGENYLESRNLFNAVWNNRALPGTWSFALPRSMRPFKMPVIKSRVVLLT